MSTTVEMTVIGYPAEDQQPKASQTPPATYSSSSSSILQPAGAAPQISTLIPIQPTKKNYFLWKSLFLSVLRPSDMLDLAEGREKCPPRYLSKEKEVENADYTDWVRRDQTLLTWINSSLSMSLLGQTADFTSGRDLWLHLETLLADKARTHLLELRNRLKNQSMKETVDNLTEKELREKRYLTQNELYLERAEEITDGLEAAGSPVDDSEYVSCVLNGLPDEYHSFVASIQDRSDPVTREQLHDSLINYETPCSCAVISTTMLLLFGTGFGIALVWCIVGGISYKFPLVLFVCFVLAAIYEIVSSMSSTTAESDDCSNKKLHTDSV